MRTVISDLLLDIASEKNGYSIGKPWRFTEHSLAAVVPIIRVTKDTRNYRLLSEVKNLVKIKDTGHIDKIELINRDEYPVLIKSGEILEGGTQTRTVTVSQIVMPQEKVVLDCACVYSSKGIMSGQDMAPSVYSPMPVRRKVFQGHYTSGKLDNLSSDLYRYDSKIQQDIWASVNQHYQSSARGFSAFAADVGEAPIIGSISYATPEQDLAGRITETQDKYKDVLKEVPKLDNQVGICLLTMSGLESMESFNHPESWEAIRKAILGSDVSSIADISDQDGLFEFREDKAKSIVRELLEKEYSEKVAVEKEGTATYILDEEKFMGEVVTLYDRPIHCAFLKKAS